MKKSILSIFLLSLLFVACKKEVENVSKTVEVSYPTINLIGPAYVYIHTGGSYSDQGATLIDDITGASSTISATDNPVDVSTPGIYKVSFTASNANGFLTSAFRTVLVLDYTPAAGLDPNLNLAGVYVRSGIPVTLYKMDVGLYISDNFAGSTLVIPAYIITPTDSTIDLPPQTSFGLSIDAHDETLTIAPPDTSFSYDVDAAGFGTQTRTFVKQ